jgi:1,4-dihydroxy-2-naphthoate octaprenyltransferase
VNASAARAGAEARPGKPLPLGAWLQAIRPRTLPVSLGPVLVGSAVAFRAGAFDAGLAFLCLLGALLLQVASNLANDVFDARRGADGPDRVGPTRVVAAGLLRERSVLCALAGVLAAALGVGAPLVAAGGWPILAIGVAGILAALAYTAGPFPLAYQGLGEVFVFLFFGLAAVAGTAFVQAGAWEREAFLCAVPLGLLAAAVLLVNNLRDVDGDARVGKRTVAVRLGRRATRGLWVGMLLAAFGVLPLGTLAGALPPAALLPLMAAPLAVSPGRAVLLAGGGPSLNAALAATARMQAVFGALLALGLVLAGPRG